MLDTSDLARIRDNPAFQELVHKRNRFAWTLAAVMFVVYMAFIFLVAFAHSVVAAPIGSGPLTLAFPLGLGVIILAIVLTGVYVVRANGEFDRLTREIVGQSRTPVAPVRARFVAGVR